jgi:peptidoglycan/xylan/chitin deacetylase (PgdA/CDA1 family)
MKKRVQRVLVLAMLPVLLLCTAAYMYRRVPAAHGEVDTILLLVPDNVDAGNIVLREWQDAAEEEGLHLRVIHDSEFLNPMRHRVSRGLIVPDLIHRSANGSLIGALHDYAQNGGKLMLVFDACTWDLDGHFAKVESRLSDLTGVSYALYDQFKTDSIHSSQIWGTHDAMQALQIPPGKYVAVKDPLFTATLKPIEQLGPGDPHPNTEDYVLSRYQYGDVSYPSYRTAGQFDGELLLQSTAGLVAGARRFGSGRVLFVNLPLSYLEGRTDGILMHAFLRYFAVHTLKLPYLSSVPDGVGGLIFNWHIDSKLHLQYLKSLISGHIFDQGPFSIHFTAGPDVNEPGDGKGIDLEHNPEAQQLIAELIKRGHVIGSHGGWIHNYFGEHLNDNNEEEFAKYLQMNTDALQKVSGKPITEYSAPVGNQPRWVSRWLEQHGMVGYYFVGDAGMPPTQVYRDQARDGSSIWAFPIVHMGKYAALEEMGFDNIPAPVVRQWLLETANYAGTTDSAHLIYTHVVGSTRYMPAMQAFLKRTAELSAEHRFRWYSMTQLGDYMNERKAVTWNVLATNNHSVLLEAQAPRTLEHQTWVFPKGQYSEPQIRQGTGTVHEQDDKWMITAGNCKQLAVEIGQR